VDLFDQLVLGLRLASALEIDRHLAELDIIDPIGAQG
jgi:hypothetical protein